jgi:hypothetical protein
VRVWIFTSVGWSVALLALIGIASIPGNNLDLYLRDTYFVIPKFALAVVTLLALVLPLAAVTIPRVRAAR